MRMGDTLESVMERKGLTRYQLSKISGIPWSTLSNICTGKTDFEKCTVGTVKKLANALDLTIEETLDLETGIITDKNGRPVNKDYLERNLPSDLQRSIDEYLACDSNCLHLDCYLDEIYGSINMNLSAGLITEEQAEYLRSKYLYGEHDD